MISCTFEEEDMCNILSCDNRDNNSDYEKVAMTCFNCIKKHCEDVFYCKTEILKRHGKIIMKIYSDNNDKLKLVNDYLDEVIE